MYSHRKLNSELNKRNNTNAPQLDIFQCTTSSIEERICGEIPPLHKPTVNFDGYRSAGQELYINSPTEFLSLPKIKQHLLLSIPGKQPASVSSARYWWNEEFLLTESSIKVRNSRWNTFLHYLRDQKSWITRVNGLLLVDFYVAMGSLPDHLLGEGADNMDRLKKAADYVSAIKHRLISIGVITDDATIKIAEHRLGIVSREYQPGQVCPIYMARMIQLSTTAYMIASFWVFGSWRESGFLSITKESFGECVTVGSAKFRRIICFHSKAAPDPSETETRLVPTRVADAVVWFFPVQASYLRNHLYYPLRITSHSFRRTWALTLRIILDSIGFDSKKKLQRLLPAINKLGGWAHDSVLFFHYSQDYLNHRNMGIFNFAEYLEYLIAYEMKKYKFSLIDTQRRDPDNSGSGAGDLLVPLSNLTKVGKLLTTGLMPNKASDTDTRVNKIPKRELGTKAVHAGRPKPKRQTKKKADSEALPATVKKTRGAKGKCGPKVAKLAELIEKKNERIADESILRQITGGECNNTE